MHIAIDARMYGTAQRGIGRYLMKLVENLEVVDKQNHYIIFLRQDNWEEYHPKNPNFKKALWDVPWYGWQEQVSGFRFQVSGFDLVHFPHWNVPIFFRRPFIVTVHDLELFSSNRTRESSTRGRLTYFLKHLAFRIVFRHAVRSAKAIIVPSSVVRQQLLDKYPQVRRKVHVIYEAPTIEGLETSTSPSPKPYPLTPSSYVLYVGAAYPHKNLPRLLEAWKIVHRELSDYKLVLVGREDYFWKRLQRDIARMGLSVKMLRSSSGHGTEGERERAQAPVFSPGKPSAVFTEAPDSELSSVIIYGSATDGQLAALYKNAALLVQPSLEEGFSLSPLEALSSNCPVAVSDIPVHREILKDGPFYFDPRDAQSIADTLSRLLKDNSLRQSIVTRGKAIAGQYSWREHAKQTLTLYETVKLG